MADLSFARTLTHLPEPTGPYQVGISKYDLIDHHRKEFNYPDGRLIPIQIYFPMQKGKHTLHKKLFEERIFGKWKPLDVGVYSQKADLSLLISGKHPVIFLLHCDTGAMTDYALLAEDLASNGCIVITIQSQLNTDSNEPKFWKERSIAKYANVTNNLLYVFEWLTDNQEKLFNNKIDLIRIGYIGHSMGGDALLLFANRASNVSKKKERLHLLPSQSKVAKEAIVVLDTGGFPYPCHNQYPLFLMFSEEQEDYQKKSGAYDEMKKIGHKVQYYKGAKHISFMDHGYINPLNPINPKEYYFNGTVEERKIFFDKIRKDIRDFLKNNGIIE